MKERHKVIPAVYLIFHNGNKILFAKRCNTGYMDGYYSLPAGHLDGGETAKDAAIREAKEEVGIELQPEYLTLLHTLHRQVDENDRAGHERIDLFFDITATHIEPRNTEPEKCSEIIWSDLTSLKKNIIPEVRHALESIAAGNNYSDFNFSKESQAPVQA